MPSGRLIEDFDCWRTGMLFPVCFESLCVGVHDQGWPVPAVARVVAAAATRSLERSAKQAALATIAASQVEQVLLTCPRLLASSLLPLVLLAQLRLKRKKYTMNQPTDCVSDLFHAVLPWDLG